MENSRDRLGRPHHFDNHRQPHGNNYLLAIGIDQYIDSTNLSNAVRDAQAFKQVLLEKYQFDPTYVHELYDQDASRTNILGKLAELEQLITKEDNFILYFSGHGSMNPQKTKGFWVPADARTQADYIPNSRIKDHLDDIQAHHIYLIVDSCFSGSIVARSTAFAERVSSMPSRRVLTSGRTEVVADGTPGKHSPFATCLLEYLRGQSVSIPASRLEQHIKEFTPRTAEQTPSSAYIHGLGDQGGEFVFHQKGYEVTANNDLSKEQHISEVHRHSETKARRGGILQRLPLIVWFLIPVFLIPLIGYLGIRHLSDSKSDVQVDTFQTRSTTVVVDTPSTPLTASDGASTQLTGEDGLQYLESLNEEKWAEIKSLFSEELIYPNMKPLGKGDLLISQSQVSQKEYKVFLHSLIAANIPIGNWTKLQADLDTSRHEQALKDVNWYGAKAYCYWLSKVSGQRFRLPESAEITDPLNQEVEWCGNEEPRERGYYADSKKPQVDTYRKPFLAWDIGFRIIRE